MHSSLYIVAAALVPCFLQVTAQADLDLDDVPTSCKTICRPLAQLSDKCDVDLRSDIDRDENLLQNQCICTNDSFDVGRIAALCADCMHQSAKKTRNLGHSRKRRESDRKRDDDDHADSDDLKDIDKLLVICGFSSTTYNPSATSLVKGISVVATAPTDISQLVTTLDGTRMPQTSQTSAATSPPSTDGSGSSSMPTTTTGGTAASDDPKETATESTAAPSDTNAATFTVANVVYVGGAALVAAALIG